MQALKVSSSDRLQVDTLRGRTVHLPVSGSGRLRAEQVQSGWVQATGSLVRVQTDSLHAAVSSSGSLAVAGSSSYAELSSSSSGSLRASKLAVQDCQARLGDSGGTQVQVARTLAARLSGSANPQVSRHGSRSSWVRLQQPDKW